MVKKEKKRKKKKKKKKRKKSSDSRLATARPPLSVCMLRPESIGPASFVGEALNSVVGEDLPGLLVEIAQLISRAA